MKIRFLSNFPGLEDVQSTLNFINQKIQKGSFEKKLQVSEKMEKVAPGA